MDLPKLLDLLHTQSLYFRRGDGFADRLEGALFPSFRQSLDEEFAKRRILNNADQFYRRSRIGNYVSCWTIGARDNMALWQLYGGVRSSIVVTTTVDRLLHCAVAWARDTHLHRVKYVDHRKVRNYVIGAYTDVLQYKSDAYRYERELRVIVPQQGKSWEMNPVSLRLKLQTADALIRSVVVAPEADESFVDAVKSLCKKYGLKAPVRRSMLALVPV
ncbi:MAG: hypothetical protein JNM76_02625 [Betaproteobacteria bacterium]|nr:hypothetical protein [Betaproteobacteria bacterium]